MMRALTIRQPWAECIAQGAKRVVNRTQSTPYRGEIAIHAGLAWAACGAEDRRCRSALGANLESATSAGGVVQAVAVLGEPHPADGCCAPWGDPVYRTVSGSDVACWHWPLLELTRLATPVPMKGALGLWRLDAEQESAVRVALRRQSAGALR